MCTKKHEILECLGKGVFSQEILEEVLSFTGDEQNALFETARNKRDAAFPKKEVEVRRREVFWQGFAAFGTSTLSVLALIGVFAAFVRTGKIQTPKS